jgi:uncharacterized membrane protein
MVLELKAPHEASWHALAQSWPTFVSYVLSFIYVGIYWNNHHHMLHTVTRVDGLILWANANLLFWLSLVPLTTAWMGEHYLAAAPTALYGVSLLLPAIAYYLLQQAITRKQGADSSLAQALGSDIKGKISPILYIAAIVLVSVSPWLSLALYTVVALMWLVPDRRIEKAIGQF